MKFILSNTYYRISECILKQYFTYFCSKFFWVDILDMINTTGAITGVQLAYRSGALQIIFVFWLVSIVIFSVQCFRVCWFSSHRVSYGYCVFCFSLTALSKFINNCLLQLLNVRIRFCIQKKIASNATGGKSIVEMRVWSVKLVPFMILHVQRDRQELIIG